ncbi:MAG: beta-lactamase family protein [Candidatus Latescibacteria bacterium]|nr:beta-lactamase family protein [Candidatus Latescibacterota bacterium]
MKKSMLSLFIYLLMATIVNFQFREQSAQGNQGSESTADSGSTVLFREFTQSILDSMAKNDIPGLSITVVNRDPTIWIDSFGVKIKHNEDRVNNKTIFSLQSVSKAVTATAVMFAVQEGLVSLDTPITEYLPDFSVNSRFEEHPKRIITLRHLLSHRAGFTHEAPIGNNYQTEFESFEQHIQSISDTWLKAPVEKIYSYSNLGIDLAGYIIQVRSGMPFTEYVKSRLFMPLGMDQSSFDWNVIRNETNRAIGHDNRFHEVPLEYAMIPSGACYTNVTDMAKFMQFHLNRGRYKNNILLEEKYLEEMYTIPFSHEKIGYGLGIYIDEKAGEHCFGHGGGGFGFLTCVQWIPHLDIGVAVLTNSQNHNNVQWAILENIIDQLKQNEIAKSNKKTNDSVSDGKLKVIDLSEDEYTKYSGSYVSTDGSRAYKVLKKDLQFGVETEGNFIPFHFFSKKGEFFVEGFGPELNGEYTICTDDTSMEPVYIMKNNDGVVLYYNEKFNPELGPDKPEWKKYIGKYFLKMFGKVIATHEVTIKNGYLYFDTTLMKEHIPGLFYLPNGEVINFLGEIPTVGNLMLFEEK